MVLGFWPETVEEKERFDPIKRHPGLEPQNSQLTAEVPTNPSLLPLEKVWVTILCPDSQL
jgi:hypothetical protein